MADPLGINLKQAQTPVITVNFPPMPKLEDFGISPEEASEWGTGKAYGFFRKQKMYEEALATWKAAVGIMAQAINTNR